MLRCRTFPVIIRLPMKGIWQEYRKQERINANKCKLERYFKRTIWPNLIIQNTHFFWFPFICAELSSCWSNETGLLRWQELYLFNGDTLISFSGVISSISFVPCAAHWSDHSLKYEKNCTDFPATKGSQKPNIRIAQCDCVWQLSHPYIQRSAGN